MEWLGRRGRQHGPDQAVAYRAEEPDRSLRHLILGLVKPGYAEEHEHLLVTYAAQVAIAIHNAQLYDELKATKDELEHVMLGQFATLRRAQMQQDLGLSDEDIQVLATDGSGCAVPMAYHYRGRTGPSPGRCARTAWSSGARKQDATRCRAACATPR